MLFHLRFINLFKTMKKDQAKKKLNELENTVKQSQQEISELRKIIESPESIMDRVRSFEDACDVLSVSTTIPDVSAFPVKLRNYFIANYKLVRIAEALNEGWTPNWSNSNEYKYYPYFEFKGTGFGFSYAIWFFSLTITAVGSRLVFKSRELAEFSGKHFEKIYSELLANN